MLIDEIIAALSDENASLSGALLKTKVLLFQIGKKELAEWVNWELNGYPSEDGVPSYRIVNAQVLANLSAMTFRASSHPIPIGHLPGEERERLTRSPVGLSLAALEHIMKQEKDGGGGGIIARPIPMEVNRRLGKSLAHGVSIDRAWCQIDPHDVETIFVNVRSRLLDFLLELKDSAGDVSGESDLKAKSDALDTEAMFKNAIFGPNATIIIGDGNLQSVRHQHVAAGDFEALSRALAAAGVPADDVSRLQAAVADDVARHGKASLEGETGKWFTGLLGRAGKKGLDVGVDVVTGVIAKLLRGYMGEA